MRWRLRSVPVLPAADLPAAEQRRGIQRWAGPAVGGSGSGARPRWSPSTSVVVYTPAQVRALTPFRDQVEARAHLPVIRAVFLCHAWEDRRGAATELDDLLESNGVSTWFSEKDILPGVPLLRAIDKGLAKSRIGVVLVTPALLTRVVAEGIAEKELSRSWRATCSSPFCTRRRTRPSARSARCSAREPASTLRRIRWQRSPSRSLSWSTS